MFPLASYVAFASRFVAAVTGIEVVVPFSTFAVKFPNPSFLS
jgi:heme A synthase